MKPIQQAAEGAEFLSETGHWLTDPRSLTLILPYLSQWVMIHSFGTDLNSIQWQSMEIMNKSQWQIQDFP